MHDPSALRLAHLCARANRVPWWTQGAGSNISIKAGGELLIKASGRRLDEVASRTAMASLAWPAVAVALRALAAQTLGGAEADAAYRACLDAHRAAGSPPPSMETGMHALVDRREVLHIHALSAVALAERARTEPAEVDALFAAAGLSWRSLPATVPGWPLALAMVRGEPADATLLANHGLVLAGDDAEALLAAYARVEGAWARSHPAREAIALVSADGAMQGDWLRQAAPFEPTLPDVSVFRDGIEAITEPAGDSGARRLAAASGAADARELWAAHLALNTFCAELPPLAAADVRRIDDSPQERWRRAQRGD